MVLQKSLRLSGLVLMAAGLANCGGNGGSTAPSLNNVSGTGGQTGPVYKIAQVRDYGVNPSDQLLHLELDGQFLGSNDVVTATCSTNGSPSVSVVSDSTSAITISMNPLDDNCTFAVQSASNLAPSVAVSSTATSLSAFSLGSISLSKDSTILNVSFVAFGVTADSSDSIYYSCDGSAYQSATTTESAAVLNPFDFAISSLSINISTPSISISPPQNPLSCHFYVLRSGVQSPIIDAYSISSTFWNLNSTTETLTLNISGHFDGSSDVVHLTCAGAEQDFSGGQLITDSTSEIQLQIPAFAADTTCSVVLSSGSTKTSSKDADYTVQIIPIFPFPGLPPGTIPGMVPPLNPTNI